MLIILHNTNSTGMIINNAQKKGTYLNAHDHVRPSHYIYLKQRKHAFYKTLKLLIYITIT